MTSYDERRVEVGWGLMTLIGKLGWSCNAMRRDVEADVRAQKGQSRHFVDWCKIRQGKKDGQPASKRYGSEQRWVRMYMRESCCNVTSGLEAVMSQLA